ncbi:uncharacterized protein LOC142538794 isoform X1 [Primulina tabacum]|uniref:uncharacterized protein LOC142538794 isoform X1 n=1 Tax=Primulina tabacum TaxID=48773 RepID=UPI003F5A46B9
MISIRVLLLRFSLLLLPCFSKFVSPFSHKTPRLTPFYKQAFITRNPDKISSATTISKDFKTYFYTQILDHFNFGSKSYETFKQKYVVNSKYWGGPDSGYPIFAYLGAEAPLDDDLGSIGFLTDNAPSFKALLVYIEHRYYGNSSPFGSLKEVIRNETRRGYFNSAQAIADYAQVLLHVKEQFSAHISPIIVVGGSYGGMLASWFRLKYPHIALGALASSAPILYFDNITPQNAYYSVVTKDFKEASETCYRAIRKSWSEIDRVASKPDGLSILSRKFNTCSKLKNSHELKDYLDTIYTAAAQYNHPPNYPVTMVCDGIDGAPKGTDNLGRIYAGIVSYRGKMKCFDTNEFNIPDEISEGWQWQTCSEMVMPIGRGEKDTMFQAAPFDLHQFIKECTTYYGVPPRPHWITTYYGGHDIKLSLNRFGSNIIFSNGLRDPYSSAGVLQDLSESVLAITTSNGSHCLDIHPSANTDPDWLIMQRNIEVNVIQGWIQKYHKDISSRFE